MAARPSRCLQRRIAAPFNVPSVYVRIRRQRKARADGRPIRESGSCPMILKSVDNTQVMTGGIGALVQFREILWQHEVVLQRADQPIPKEWYRKCADGDVPYRKSKRSSGREEATES